MDTLVKKSKFCHIQWFCRNEKRMSDSDESSSSQEESAEETQAVATYGGPVKPY